MESKIELKKSNFHVSRSIPIALIMCALIGCGEKGSHHRREPASPPPADRTTQTKTQTQDKEKKQTTAENQATDQTKVTPQTQPQQQAQADTKGTGVAGAAKPGTPSTETPSQPSTKPEASARPEPIESTFNLPEVTPLDTFGGQLLASYLSGEISGEQVISQVFDNTALVKSNLAEMSAAIWTLRQNKQFSDQDQAKILILEGAMTRFLNEQLRSSQRYAAALDYGTAITLGAIGGYYSNEILRGLRRFANSSIVQIPWGYVKKGGSYVGDATSPAWGWFRNRWAGSRAGTTASADDAASASSDMYRRTVGFMNAPATPEDRQLTVFHNIYRVINSPQLAKGYRVDPIPVNRLDFAKRQEFYRTGIPGFQISQPAGKDYLLAQLVSRGGDLEYYRVTGVAIKAVTKDGSETVVPPEAITGSIYARLRGWGERTASSIGSATKNGYGYVKDSRPVRYLTTDPLGRRIGQGALVGVPISAMTLLALRPLDTSYITLDDYARELESEGLHVNLNNYTDSQRQKALSGR